MSATTLRPPQLEVSSVKLPGETIRWATAADEETIREWLAREVAARSGLDAWEVEIVSSPGRKPRVEIAAGKSEAWQVSLSYTAQRVAGAIAFGRSVGIDLEWIDPGFKWEPVAAEFFPAMHPTWRLLPSDRARREFFQQWVRGEAALKCRGLGVAGTMEVASRPGRGMRLLDLNLPPGYAGCLAWTR